MAKKTENKPKEQEAAPVTQENADVTPESAAETQEAAQENPEPTVETEAALEKREPEQAADSMMTRMEEILNGDIVPAEKNTPQEDDDQQNTDQPQEKILFYVKTVNDKTAIRSTPEYPMSGVQNIIDIITDRGPYGIVETENGFGRIADRGPYGIVETENGFGRIAERAGWITLDPSVVIRQG